MSNSVETSLPFSNLKSDVLSWFVMASDGVIREFRLVGQEILIVNNSLCDDILYRSSRGCSVMMTSACRDGDNFSDIRGTIPSSVVVIKPAPTGLSDCELVCKSNCSCSAFAFSDNY